MRGGFWASVVITAVWTAMGVKVGCLEIGVVLCRDLCVDVLRSIGIDVGGEHCGCKADLCGPIRRSRR